MPASRCVALVLAGGRSSRLGGIPKALAPLAGRTMLSHVLDALRPQVTQILLSVGAAADGDLERAAEFRAFGLPLLADQPPSLRGPLAGLHAGLEWLAGSSQSGSGQPDWLLLCPCDAPFLPPDLALRLLQAAAQRRVPIACAVSGSIAQPTFSVWHVSALPAVEAALAEAEGAGLMRVLDSLPHTLVQWPEAVPPPFFNVNTPAELAQAETWLRHR